VSLDVLKQADDGSANANTICDPRPEVSGVVLSLSLSGGRERLAGVASREDVHQSMKLAELEGLEIRPDRCCVQESRFHFCDQVRADESFDLTKSDCAQASDNS